jgi:hypothetical protein
MRSQPERDESLFLTASGLCGSDHPGRVDGITEETGARVGWQDGRNASLQYVAIPEYCIEGIGEKF